jgi:hypothetical protein
MVAAGVLKIKEEAVLRGQGYSMYTLGAMIMTLGDTVS